MFDTGNRKSARYRLRLCSSAGTAYADIPVDERSASKDNLELEASRPCRQVSNELDQEGPPKPSGETRYDPHIFSIEF